MFSLHETHQSLELWDMCWKGSGELLAIIKSLRPQLRRLIESGFGLPHQLVSNEALTDEQKHDMLRQSSVYKRNDMILDHMATEQQCEKLLQALEQTEQQHVINFVRKKGG